MKKKLLSIVLALVMVLSLLPAAAMAAPEGVAINETNFPDANFREFVKQYDTEDGGNGYLSAAELAAVTVLNCRNKGIKDLKGIEYFTALNTLNCSDNNLTSLDVSANTALMTLDCPGNQLTSLDVSGCTALEILYCFNNQLTSLDVSGCTALEWFNCCYNELTSLDVSHNTALELLGCYGNQFTSLDVSAVPKIRDAVVNGTKDSSNTAYDTYSSNQGDLYVNKTVTLITETAPDGVAINETNFPDANFREFVKRYDTENGGDGCLSDAELAAVNYMDCSEKNIADLKGIEHFTAMKELDCYGNKLTGLDVSGCTALESLDCDYNHLTSLDVSGNTALKILYCHYNQLESLDVSGNTALETLGCSNNLLESLDISHNTALETLGCYNNELTSLDVSHNTALVYLACYGNELTGLDVSHNTALNTLDCDKNQLTSLDVSHNTALERLWCDGNELTSLDVSANTALKGLYCIGNNLTSLDVSANTALEWLSCYGNQLTSLNVSAVPAIRDAVVNGTKDSSNSNYDYYHSEQGKLFVDKTVTLITDSAAPEPVYTVSAPADKTIEATEQRQDIGNPTVTADSSVNAIGMRVIYTMLTYGDKSIGLTISCHQPGSTYAFFDAETGCIGTAEAAVYISQESADDLITIVSAWVNSDDLANAAPGTYTSTLTYIFRVYPKEGGPIEEVERTQTLTLVVPEPAPDGVAINETNFPDANFREFVKRYDTEEEGKGYLSDAELAAVNYMDCSEKNIADLKGVEHFTALKELYCSENQLTSLDLSHNTALVELVCSNNQMTSLDVRANTAMTSLTCYNNQLTSLDLSSNTALRSLFCAGNQLTGLDVSANTDLTYLGCYNNELTGLDLSHNTALNTLDCDNNQLTSLDVSHNTALERLWCDGNELTSLDVSANTALKELYCIGNNLTSLDVSHNTALEWLSCYGNQLTSLDVSAVPAIRDAVVNGTKDSSNTAYDTYSSTQGDLYVNKTVTLITGAGVAINETNFPDANFREFVKQYDTEDGGNGYLSAAELAAVTVLNCRNKGIKDLKGIEYFTALNTLTCSDNNLTSLDVSANTALMTLNCPGNQLTSLDVSGCTALEILYCFNNQLTSLDVSANTALTSLGCEYNQLTSLDVSANTALTHLGCEYNQLTGLDVSHNTALKMLDCDNNQLTSLDVSHNTALERLWCDGNELTSLDVSANTALKGLYCIGNNLTSLDVSANTALEWLSCYGNQLTSLDVSAVPAIRDAVVNGAKDSSNPDYDAYTSEQGRLYVDKTVTLITETTPEPISSAAITLDAPVIGAQPDYTAEFPEGVNYYSDAYNYYNYRNDIVWYEDTAGQFENSADPESVVFQAGHQYRVYVYLTARDGYEFTGDTTATVNGQPAVVSMYSNQLRVEYTFPVLEEPAVTEYPLWLGETQVTSWNKDDILGDRTASFDPETNTLTFTTETPAITGLHKDALIYSDGNNLTINTAGKLTLVNNGGEYDDCINVAYGYLTINGDVDVTAGWYGIYAYYNLTVYGSVKAEGKSPVYAGAVGINGNADVTGVAYGIYAYDNISVTGNVKAYADADGLYASHKSIDIGGSLTVTGGADSGADWCSVFAYETISVGGDVKVESQADYGMLCNDELVVGPGKWDVAGAKIAICVTDGITLKETHGITLPENGKIGPHLWKGYLETSATQNEDGTVAAHVIIERVKNMKGDVSGDDIVDNRDLILVARYLVHLVEFDAMQLAAADWNGDGLVNNSDLVQIARYIVSENG